MVQVVFPKEDKGKLFLTLARIGERIVKRLKEESKREDNRKLVIKIPPTRIGERIVKKLGSSLARHTGEEETTTIKHLFQQLSLALVKGNAALLNIRNPDGAGEGDEGIGWR